MEHDGGRVLVQIVYYDFKHISSVRSELAQMMPEVEFTKIKRDFTDNAEIWALHQMMWSEMGNNGHTRPVLFVQQGDNLVKTSLRDIARAELSQLEIDDDEIPYREDGELSHFNTYDNQQLMGNAWD